MSHNIQDFLDDILLYAEKAEETLGTATFEEFEADFSKKGLVTFCIQIIGEAVKNIPDDIRSKYPEIFWKNWAGMRDRLVHKYWDVRLDIVYGTAIEDIPELKRVVRLILEDLKNQPK